MLLDRFEFLLVQYKLRSFNVNEFKFVSHEIEWFNFQYLTLVFCVMSSPVLSCIELNVFFLYLQINKNMNK